MQTSLPSSWRLEHSFRPMGWHSRVFSSCISVGRSRGGTLFSFKPTEPLLVRFLIPVLVIFLGRQMCLGLLSLSVTPQVCKNTEPSTSPRKVGRCRMRHLRTSQTLWLKRSQHTCYRCPAQKKRKRKEKKKSSEGKNYCRED